MYKEEKIINGVLMCKVTPSSKWEVKYGQKAQTINELTEMTAEQRMDVFSFFCTHCGSDNKGCQCWNDE